MPKVIGAKNEYQIDFEAGNHNNGSINDSSFLWDLQRISDSTFHCIIDHRSYTVEVVSFDKNEKTMVLSVNGNIYNYTVKDRMDELLEKMGMSDLSKIKISEVKAPMPGLVLEINVSPGDSVQKGDALIVLEAMKMENILKSPADGVIKSIRVTKGQAIEKNEVILNFE